MHIKWQGDEIALTRMTRDEVSTIYFALREYQDNLEKSVKKSRKRNIKMETHFEDLRFLYESLHKVMSVVDDLTNPHIDPSTPSGPAGRTYTAWSEDWRRFLDVI